MKVNETAVQGTPGSVCKVPSSMEHLRASRPDLFQSPEYWPSSNEEIALAVQRATVGTPEIIGKSAGGRDIHAVSYGEFEPQSPTATISSANASDRPETFYDPAKRTKPTLVIIGSIHGGETEGVALAQNLIAIMETGCDLRGRDYSALREKYQKARLVIIPCLNPDGREAAGVAHLCGAELEHLFFVQQGILPDGTLFRGRKIKEVQPIPRGYLRHQGGYYNDAGVNLQHDDFFGPKLSLECEAIRNLFRREIPDAFLTLHAHGGPAAFMTPDAFLSPGYQRKQIEMAAYVLSRLAIHNIQFTPPERIVAPPWSFYFQTWLHHATGALPMLFEFCHGLAYRPCTLEATLDTGLVLADGWVDYCLKFGTRPQNNDLFGPVVRAD